MDASENAAISRRVMVIDGENAAALRATTEALGYVVIRSAGGDDEAMEVFRAADPEVVIVLIKPAQSSGGLALAKRLTAVRRRPMVVVGPDDGWSAAELLEAGAFAYLPLPVSPTALRAAIEIAARRFTELQVLAHEKNVLAQTLETRKLVERAKGIFMKRLKLDESEAHKRLQQESQNRRMSLAELARRVIESEELLSSA